ncbi:MAG: class I SAM-dependent methyltransferase [Candidatus Nanoarchaeia archaeon]
MNQEQIWDNLAGTWQAYRQNPKQEVVDFLSNIDGKILDLGCGSGRHFIKGKHIYGIDISSKMLDYAREKADKLGMDIELKKSPAHIIPYPDKYFDAVIFSSVLQCIERQEEREQAIKEVYRVLKPKGRVFISVMSINNQRAKQYGDTSIPWTVGKKKYNRYYYIYKKDELENLLKRNGFSILSSKETNRIDIVAEKST